VCVCVCVCVCLLPRSQKTARCHSSLQMRGLNSCLFAATPPPHGDPGRWLFIDQVQGYLAHKKQPPPLGLPEGPRHKSAEGSWRGAVSYGRGTPAASLLKTPCLAGVQLRVMRCPRGLEPTNRVVSKVDLINNSRWTQSRSYRLRAAKCRCMCKVDSINNF